MSTKEKKANQEVISRKPFPNSKKIYVKGQIHNISVAMREVSLSETKLSNDKVEKNAPVTLYDASGPYTDPAIDINIHNGLPRLRESWIKDRNDVEELSAFSSEYGNERMKDESLNDIRFKNLHKPLKAKNKGNVTQLYYRRSPPTADRSLRLRAPR